MHRTIIVRRNYAHYIKKYARRVCTRHLLPHRTPTRPLLEAVTQQLLLRCRYEKRHGNIPAHVSPCFRVNEGDTVVIGQCRCGAAHAGRGHAGQAMGVSVSDSSARVSFSLH
jgi:small subunit ribosomal protein S11e